MKKISLFLILSLMITSVFGYVVNAQSGYYMSEEDYQQEQAHQDNLQNQADMQEYELDSKVAAAEAQDKKESAEAAESNKRLLVYVGLGAGGLILIFLISHSWQKYKFSSSYRK